MSSEKRGELFILSAPSGSGKTSLAKRALPQVPGLCFSVSYTTRSPRQGERDGIEYYFVAPDQFKEMTENEEFLEWAHVYGHSYGTSRRFVEQKLSQGNDVLLDIDVQGARKVRDKLPESHLIFVFPPSYEVLEQRLRRRGLDDESVITSRLHIARSEIGDAVDYDYFIFNDDIDQAVAELKSIIWAARCRRDRRMASAKRVLASFARQEKEKQG